MPDAFTSLVFADTFFETFASREFGRADRRAFLEALKLLDENESHPGLRVHQLRGQLRGIWSVSASRSLRMTFQRLDDGRKVMLTCSRHYGD